MSHRGFYIFRQFQRKRHIKLLYILYAYIHTYTHTGRQTDRQTDRQMDRKIKKYN